MRFRPQRERQALAHPLWLRVLAAWCLLLVGVASTAQAAHIHGSLLPAHGTQVSTQVDASQAPGGEEHCPLCVAMHAALPATATQAVAPSLAVECRVELAAARAPLRQWHFPQLSRPPPALRS